MLNMQFQMRTIFPLLFVGFLLLTDQVFADVAIGHQPSTMEQNGEAPAVGEAVFYVESDLSDAVMMIEEKEQVQQLTTAIGKEDTSKKEEEPALEPMVLAGTGAAAAGAGTAVAGLFAAPILIAIGALLLVASAVLTTIGWKKIKAEPKKYRGEKFAIANFIIIGVIGVAASFYALYLLFAV